MLPTINYEEVLASSAATKELIYTDSQVDCSPNTVDDVEVFCDSVAAYLTGAAITVDSSNQKVTVVWGWDISEPNVRKI